ncbi:MAG: hypothetical protein ACI976_001992, partial [Aureispira sp.]
FTFVPAGTAEAWMVLMGLLLKKRRLKKDRKDIRMFIIDLFDVASKSVFL